MKIAKKQFEQYITQYEEDEIFYRDLYNAEKLSPEALSDYIASLDLDYVNRHRLYVPEIHGHWFSYVTEKDYFELAAKSIIAAKHYRYSPKFVHEHEFYEFFYVYSGSCKNTIQEIVRSCQKGDICIIPPKTRHSIEVFDDSVVINFMLKTSVFHSTFFEIFPGQNTLSTFFSHILYGKTENNYLLFHTGDDPVIRSVVEDIFIEYMGHDKYYLPLLSSYLMTFWSLLLRLHEDHMECFMTTTNKQISTMEVLNYFQKNYYNISLESAAKHFGFSAPHFSKLVKDNTGQNFVDLIRNIKLEKACHALRNTELSIANICEIVGYANPEHFTRVFKKEFKTTPGEFRRKSRA